jgi:hypothetical protein
MTMVATAIALITPDSIMDLFLFTFTLVLANNALVLAAIPLVLAFV